MTVTRESEDLRDLALTRDAVMWRNSGDLRTSVLSVRARLMQVAYAMVGAGVGGVSTQMPVCAGETFGPVLSLYPTGSDHEAVQLANRGSYGVSASVWSRDVRAARQLASQVRAGSVNINDGAAAAAASVEAPMGGMGDSGLGRRHGAEGIRRFTEAQTVAVQRLLPLGPPPALGVQRFVAMTNAQLRLLKRLRVR